MVVPFVVEHKPGREHEGGVCYGPEVGQGAGGVVHPGGGERSPGWTHTKAPAGYAFRPPLNVWPEGTEATSPGESETLPEPVSVIVGEEQAAGAAAARGTEPVAAAKKEAPATARTPSDATIRVRASRRPTGREALPRPSSCNTSGAATEKCSHNGCDEQRSTTRPAG